MFNHGDLIYVLKDELYREGSYFYSKIINRIQIVKEYKWMNWSDIPVYSTVDGYLFSENEVLLIDGECNKI